MTQPNLIPTLPATGYLRIKQVLQFIPVSKSTWWNGVKDGRFPQAVKLGPRTTAWRAEDIKSYIEQFEIPAREKSA